MSAINTASSPLPAKPLVPYTRIRFNSESGEGVRFTVRHDNSDCNFAELNAPLVAALQAEPARSALVAAAPSVRRFMDDLGATRMRFIPYPLVIDRDEFDRMAEAACAMIEAQTAVIREFLRSGPPEKLLTEFGLPAEIAPFVNWEQLDSVEQVFARVDVLPTPSGYQFCEFNIDSSISGFEFHDCYQVMGEAVDIPWLAGTPRPEEQIADVVIRAFHQGSFDRVVVCDWSSRIGVGYFGFELLTETLRRRLPDVPVELVFHADYPERWLDPAAGKRTLVYRGFMHEDMDDDYDFITRLVGSGASVINLFEAEIRTHKRWLAMLWEERFASLLPEGVRDMVARYVPHTVSVTPENRDRLLADRAEYVFKFGHSSGGHDVLLGADHDADTIAARLAERGPDGWLAQRRVQLAECRFAPEADAEPVPHHVVLGLYVLGGECSGMNIRADRGSAVVNIHQSAASGWAIPMDADERRQLIERVQAIGPAARERH